MGARYDFVRGLFAGAVALSGTMAALAADGDWQLLKRAEIAGNGQPLNGTYLHQVGASLETFRLSRFGLGKHFIERRWSLDGSPREVIRQGERITCYAQDEKSLKATKISAMRLFPDVLSIRLKDVSQSYVLKRTGQDRVAQRDCTLLELHPKDKQRFSVRLCLDQATALPLKMVTLMPSGETVEQYTFTQLELAEPKNKQELRPQYKLAQRLTLPSVVTQAVSDKAVFGVEGLPPGFRLLRSVQRILAGNEVRQMVFSDGLVMLSLFIEPSVKGDLRADKMGNLHGAIGMATLTQLNQQLTLVGDMPEPLLSAVIKSVKIIQKS